MPFSDAGVSILFSRAANSSSTGDLLNDPAPDLRTPLLAVFLTLQIIGLVGSGALVLTTTLSSRAPRNATWQNFFTSWIISTVSYSLILFAGQIHLKNPTFGVCLAQAGLIYGIPALTAASTFGLIAQIWFSVQTLLLHKVKYERICTMCILILPYFVLFGMVVASWITGINNPSRVQLIGSGMYCHIGPSAILYVRANASHKPHLISLSGKASAALVALTLIPTLALEIAICIALRRNWAAFKKMKHSLSITIRVLIFTLFGILAISLSAVFVFSNNHGAAINVVIATLPVIAVIIFASQKDILLVWMFWRPRPPMSDTKDLSSDSDSYMRESDAGSAV
uniref:G-protein coupled receptors family 3 profile domain-containing protein n=1 Tax=Mycena chlorophos TaxID=658473 RepID=A0ABQ0L9V8_MYCCL|nr:predicted protein [Mycena chlorophos]